MSYMGGIRWGGGGHLSGGPPCQDQRRGSYVNNFLTWSLRKFNCQLSDYLFGGLNFFQYLCSVTFLIGGDRVDSDLPYIIYNGDQIIIPIVYCHVKHYDYICSMITILYLILPLVIIRLYMYLTPIVSRSYRWVINFLELWKQSHLLISYLASLWCQQHWSLGYLLWH